MASHGIPRTSRIRNEEQQKLQARDKIQKYRDLEEQLRAHVEKNDYSGETFQLTSKLLRLNPEYYTVWNVRRRVLLSGLLSRAQGESRPAKETPGFSAGKCGARADTGTGDAGTSDREGDEEAKNTDQDKSADKAAAENDLNLVRSELGFTIPLLIESPKCYWIWHYRTWILQQAIERLEVSEARGVWEEELGLASKMLNKDRRNFHAWGYRRHLVRKLESPELDGKSMAEAEFEYTSKMIRVDLSNFSAWHNRSKLIPRLLDERGASDQERRTFFDEELSLVREALNVGPEDQSLWYYHQFLVLNLTNFVGRPTITPNFTAEDRVTYLTREIQDILDLLEDYKDIKWIYETLVEYTLSLCQLENRDPHAGEKVDIQKWLSNLKVLDPMRNGRWRDLEEDLQLK